MQLNEIDEDFLRKVADLTLPRIYSQADVDAFVEFLSHVNWQPYLQDMLTRRQEINERRDNYPVTCRECGTNVRSIDSVRLNAPGIAHLVYCTACAEVQRAKRQRACEMCGSLYYARNITDAFRLCDTCVTPERIRESLRVRAQNTRTQQLGLVSDLRIAQWITTLEYFQRTCAYCQAAPFTDLEHFIPVNEGGGTTWTNCVPACERCNQRKRYNGIEQEAMERVGAYLLSLSHAA